MRNGFEHWFAIALTEQLKDSLFFVNTDLNILYGALVGGCA